MPKIPNKNLKTKKMRNILLVFLLGLMFIACDSKREYDVYETLPDSWAKEHTVSFQFKAPDTINTYNLFINLRNNDDYVFSNLFLIANFQSPDNNETVDTLAYEMAKPSGEWLGSGFSTKENKLYFKDNFHFKQNGEHVITLSHAMRKNGSVLGVEDLKGITEVGFRIEKATN